MTNLINVVEISVTVNKKLLILNLFFTAKMGGNIFSGCTAPETGVTETPRVSAPPVGKGILANPSKGPQTPTVYSETQNTTKRKSFYNNQI